MFGEPGNNSSGNQSTPSSQSPFGKPITTNTFGDAAAPVSGSTNNSLFGSKPPGATTGGLQFGSPAAAPAFGQQPTGQPSFGGFSLSNTNTGLSGSQQNANTSLSGASNPTPAFGQQPTGQPSFGGFSLSNTNTGLSGSQQNANTSLSGASNPTPAFGQQPTGQPSFGGFSLSNTNTGLSGSQQNANTSLSGASNPTPAFGQQPTGQPSFGGFSLSNTNTGLSGSQQNANTSLSGASNPTPAFGQPTKATGFRFRAPTGTGLSGSQGNANTSLSGASNPTPAFGLPTKATGFGFGAPTGTGLIGQTQQPAQQTAPSLFGSTNTAGNTSLFGSTTGFAGNNTAVGMYGTVVEFSPLLGNDTEIKHSFARTISTRHYCITCMKVYEGKSLEELRLEDYVAWRKRQTSGLFGSPAQSSLFGNAGVNTSTANTATTISSIGTLAVPPAATTTTSPILTSPSSFLRTSASVSKSSLITSSSVSENPCTGFTLAFSSDTQATMNPADNPKSLAPGQGGLTSIVSRARVSSAAAPGSDNFLSSAPASALNVSSVTDASILSRDSKPSALETVLAEVRASSALLSEKMDQKIDGLATKVDALSQSTDELVAELSGKVEALSARNGLLEDQAIERNARFAAENAELADRLMVLERNALSCNLLIAGVPQQDGEQLTAIFRSSLALLSVTVQDAEVLKIVRFKSSRVTGKPPTILVRLSTMDCRNRVIAAKRAKGSIYADELGLPGDHPHSPVYINEHLPPAISRLLRKTSDRARPLGFSYVWVKNGLVHAKRDSTSQPLIIRSEDDLGLLTGNQRPSANAPVVANVGTSSGAAVPPSSPDENNSPPCRQTTLASELRSDS